MHADRRSCSMKKLDGGDRRPESAPASQDAPGDADGAVASRDFAQRREEYAALQQRFEDSMRLWQGQTPIFVAHDSLIRDTSVVNGREVINLGSCGYIGP